MPRARQSLNTDVHLCLPRWRQHASAMHARACTRTAEAPRPSRATRCPSRGLRRAHLRTTLGSNAVQAVRASAAHAPRSPLRSRCRSSNGPRLAPARAAAWLSTRKRAMHLHHGVAPRLANRICPVRPVTRAPRQASRSGTRCRRPCCALREWSALLKSAVSLDSSGSAAPAAAFRAPAPHRPRRCCLTPRSRQQRAVTGALCGRAASRAARPQGCPRRSFRLSARRCAILQSRVPRRAAMTSTACDGDADAPVIRVEAPPESRSADGDFSALGAPRDAAQQQQAARQAAFCEEIKLLEPHRPRGAPSLAGKAHSARPRWPALLPMRATMRAACTALLMPAHRSAMRRHDQPQLPTQAGVGLAGVRFCGVHDAGHAAGPGLLRPLLPAGGPAGAAATAAECGGRAGRCAALCVRREC
jgi:hypothetical protein